MIPSNFMEVNMRGYSWFSQELYHELHTLDRFEQDYHRKRLEDEISSSAHKGLPPLLA